MEISIKLLVRKIISVKLPPTLNHATLDIIVQKDLHSRRRVATDFSVQKMVSVRFSAMKIYQKREMDDHHAIVRMATMKWPRRIERLLKQHVTVVRLVHLTMQTSVLTYVNRAPLVSFVTVRR